MGRDDTCGGKGGVCPGGDLVGGGWSWNPESCNVASVTLVARPVHGTQTHVPQLWYKVTLAEKLLILSTISKYEKNRLTATV